jgi:hypothetical protein
MAALPVIPDTYLITQHLSPTLSRHPFINRFCVTEATHLYNAADAAAFALTYKTNILPLMSSDILLGNTDVLPLDGTSSTASYTTASAGSAGGNSAGTDMPEACALVIAWQTGHRGRSYRGRSYIPGVRTNYVTDPRTNNVTSAGITALTTAGNNFIAGLLALAVGQGLDVLSLKLGVKTTVANARGNATLGIQRRRYESVARH